jgi:hypothetical protein
MTRGVADDCCIVKKGRRRRWTIRTKARWKRHTWSERLRAVLCEADGSSFEVVGVIVREAHFTCWD